MKRGTLKKTVLSIISPNQYSGIDKKEAGELPFDRFSRLSTFKLSSLSNVGANDGSMALKCDHTSRESSRNISLAPCVTNKDRMFCYSHVAVPIAIRLSESYQL